MIKLIFVYVSMFLITGCSNNYGDTYHYKNRCGYDILVDNSFYSPYKSEINDKNEAVIYLIFSQIDIGKNTAEGAKKRLREWQGDKTVTVFINEKTNERREISGNELANAFNQADLMSQTNISHWLIDDVRFCPDSRNKYNKEMNKD